MPGKPTRPFLLSTSPPQKKMRQDAPPALLCKRARSTAWEFRQVQHPFNPGSPARLRLIQAAGFVPSSPRSSGPDPRPPPGHAADPLPQILGCVFAPLLGLCHSFLHRLAGGCAFEAGPGALLSPFLPEPVRGRGKPFRRGGGEGRFGLVARRPQPPLGLVGSSPLGGRAEWTGRSFRRAKMYDGDRSWAL